MTKWHFFDHFTAKLTSIDVKYRLLTKNWHPMHSLTSNIDKNHHKNHQQVVLWPSISQKLIKWHFFDHFTLKLTSIGVRYRLLTKKWHPMHSLTSNIDKNHHKNHQKVVLWPSVSQKLIKWHFFDHFTAKLTSIDVKYRLLTKNWNPMHSLTSNIDKKHHKNHQKEVLWPSISQKLRKWHFFDHFTLKLTSIDVRYRLLTKKWHPMHSLTSNIDKNHHKNHQKVVLWPSISQKFTKWHFFDHFTPKLTSIDVKKRVLA